MNVTKSLFSLTLYFLAGIVMASNSLPSLTPEEITSTQAQYIAQFNNAERSSPINKQLVYTLKPPITATLKMTSDNPVNNWSAVQLFAPTPPNLDRQTVFGSPMLMTSPTSEVGYPQKITDLSPFHHSLLVSQISTLTHPTGFSAVLQMHMQLKQIQLVDVKPGDVIALVPELTQSERSLSLRATDLFDYNNVAFKQWLDENNLHPTANETRFDFAKRVYIFIQNHFQYYYDPNWDRSATNTIATGMTDCGGFSILYSSVMRYHGIPALALAGRWAISGNDADQYQAHVKSEFYLDKIGWVPVDVTSGVLYHKKPAGLRFFAQDPGNFIVLHVDPDLVLDTMYGNKSFNFLQDFAYWISTQSQFILTESETWTVN